MNLEILEHSAARIRASDYEGWVAHTNTGDVIYESLADDPKRIQLGAGIVATVQLPDRTTLDWMDLPHDIVDHIELYWHRDIFRNQPVVRISRPPNETKIRFIQYKMRGLQFSGVSPDARRTGIMWYRLGFWDSVANVTKLVEVGLKGAGDGKITGDIQELQAAHPCWPKPLGFGINPVFVGITEAQVPSVPTIP
jgi:hypothetical protein